MKRRRNILIWAGFAIAVVALVSYTPLFAQFPVTRDVPWANYLLFAVAICLLAVGLKRAFKEPQVYRGKITGSILGILSVLMLAFFCFVIFYAGKQVPASLDALRPGQPAATFTLADANGKQVELSGLLKGNRGALLIFYRGYW
jgi:drug/metabolite transporter (DMT)-like permease